MADRRRTKKKQDKASPSDDDGTQVEDKSTKKRKQGTKKRKTKTATMTEGGGANPPGKAALREFIISTCKIGFTGLLGEFMDIKMATQAIGGTPKTAFDSNPDKNRYKDVYCVDEDRVVLTYPPGCNDYIHANWVTTPDGRKYICTQGPIAATIDDFWRMIWQEKCKGIVMLCNICELGKKKCEQYWPENIGQEQTNGPLTVKSVSTSEFEKVMTVTNISVTDGNDTLEVEHIKWNNWPDRGVPSDPTTCFKLLAKIKTLSPVAIHCSAGIGRTGSIVGLDLLMSRLLKGENVTLKQIVLELRAKRHGSVQMDIQYLFIARAMAAYAISRKVVKEEEVKEFITTFDNHCRSKGFF